MITKWTDDGAMMVPQPEAYGRAAQDLGLAKRSSGQRRWQDRMELPTKKTDSGVSYFLHSTSSCSLTFISHCQGCDYPPEVAHGHYEEIRGFRVLIENEVLYKCDKGYTLVGEARLSCKSSRWTPAAPQCRGNCSSLFSHVDGSVTRAWRHLIWFDLFEIMTMLRMQTVQRNT